jgi:hypothetical protein
MRWTYSAWFSVKFYREESLCAYGTCFVSYELYFSIETVSTCDASSAMDELQYVHTYFRANQALFPLMSFSKCS